jgi:hypothetical protein
MIKTAGSKDDVTRALNLPEDLAKNVAFSGTLACETSAQSMVLAISVADGRYGRLNQTPCR